MHVFDESREMYLKTIYMLNLDNEIVRAVDVASELDFSRPSVSRAIKKLVNDNELEILDTGHLQLTDIGLKAAKTIYEKNLVISDFLRNVLKLDKKIAEKDACRIEHVISTETFEALKKLLK